MSVVDRIMRAYVSKHRLNPSQTNFVREKISELIDELKAGRLPTIAPHDVGANAIEQVETDTRGTTAGPTHGAEQN